MCWQGWGRSYDAKNDENPDFCLVAFAGGGSPRLADDARAAHADRRAVYRHRHGRLPRHRGDRRRREHRDGQLADRQLCLRLRRGLSRLHLPGDRRKGADQSAQSRGAIGVNGSGGGTSFYSADAVAQRPDPGLDAGDALAAPSRKPLFLHPVSAHAASRGQHHLRHGASRRRRFKNAHARGRGRESHQCDAEFSADLQDAAAHALRAKLHRLGRGARRRRRGGCQRGRLPFRRACHHDRVLSPSAHFPARPLTEAR